MPGITASDVVQDDDVQAIVNKIRNQKYQARRAFQPHNATNLDSNSFNFPVSDNNLDGEAVEIPEGSEYPRSGLSWSNVSAAYSKYGLEIAISDETVSDSAIDVALNAQEDMIRAEESRMDNLAFNVLSSNTNSNGPIDAGTDNTFDYSDIGDARQLAFNDELNLGEIIIVASGQNMTDFTNMTEFTQASEMGDMVIETGVLPGGDMVGEDALLGTVNDIPVYLSNSGAFTHGQAFLVDTSDFGYESVRWEQELNQYRSEETDEDIWKIRGRWDWVAVNSTANIEIDATA